jgi:Rieske Fe-S protein
MVTPMVQWVTPPPDLRGRRNFLLWLLGSLTGGFAALFGYTTAIFTRPPRVPGQRTQIKVNRADLHEGANQFRLLGQTLYVVLRRDEVKVLGAKCSHLGCLVIWDDNADGFLCPCHGAVFAADGTAVRGPTTTPLTEIAFVESEGIITIGEAT